MAPGARSSRAGEPGCLDRGDEPESQVGVVRARDAELGRHGVWKVTPAEIVGLLADADRRRVVASLILGASTADDIARTAGLDARAVATSLHRLTERGLVIRDGDHVFVVEEAFAVAARAAAAAPVPLDPDVDPEVARVMRAFVRDDRITQIPMQHGKRRILLEWLVQDFEPGRRYSEKMVNLILGRRHPDTAALRRALVDEDLMDRDHGEYWRIGGPVDTAPSPPA